MSPMATRKAYLPLIPFPQRLARFKLDKQFDALQMSTNAKFFKDILANRRKLDEYEIVGIIEMQPTNMSLQLVDQSVKHLVEIIKDVPVKVGDMFFLCDFVILEIEEDANILIILYRPFLATIDVNISLKKGKLSLIVDEKTI
ncbi:hypothetical protein CR513_59581, partial [Mucuna pruriens]